MSAISSTSFGEQFRAKLTRLIAAFNREIGTSAPLLLRARSPFGFASGLDAGGSHAPEDILVTDDRVAEPTSPACSYRVFTSVEIDSRLREAWYCQVVSVHSHWCNYIFGVPKSLIPPHFDSDINEEPVAND